MGATATRLICSLNTASQLPAGQLLYMRAGMRCPCRIRISIATVLCCSSHCQSQSCSPHMTVECNNTCLLLGGNHFLLLVSAALCRGFFPTKALNSIDVELEHFKHQLPSCQMRLCCLSFPCIKSLPVSLIMLAAVYKQFACRPYAVPCSLSASVCSSARAAELLASLCSTHWFSLQSNTPATSEYTVAEQSE